MLLSLLFVFVVYWNCMVCLSVCLYVCMFGWLVGWLVALRIMQVPWYVNEHVLVLAIDRFFAAIALWKCKLQFARTVVGKNFC